MPDAKNVFSASDGSINFETNEVGLKGDPLDTTRKLAVVWGDSVVFCANRGWPCLLDRLAPGWQFLNGGIDGDLYINILRRASEFNRRHSVALNLLLLGWHLFDPGTRLRRDRRDARLRHWLAGTRPPQPGNRRLAADLTAFLRAVPNTVVVTMPTALNPRIIDQDLSSYMVDGDDETAFRYWFSGNTRPIELQRLFYAHILERNAIAREVCARLGIRVIDLFSALNTENQADFREHFVDVLHLRLRSHPRVAQIVYDNIKDLVA